MGEVEALLEASDHPSADALREVRRVILDADPRISDGIKWNAPSFRTSADWFATFHLRAKHGVQVILHHGAKARADEAPAVDDPAGLLEWLGKDRATVRFRDAADVREKRDAFSELIRRWIEHV